MSIEFGSQEAETVLQRDKDLEVFMTVEQRIEEIEGYLEELNRDYPTMVDTIAGYEAERSYLVGMGL